MIDTELVEAFLRAQPLSAAILRPDGSVLASNTAFKAHDIKEVDNAALLTAIGIAIRTNAAIPTSLVSEQGARKLATLTSMAIGSERLVYLQFRATETEFSRLSKGLTRLNAEVSKRSRHDVTLRQVLDATADGVLICNAEGLVLESNEASHRILGPVENITNLVPGHSWRALLNAQPPGGTVSPIRMTFTSEVGEDLTLDLKIGHSRSIDGPIYVILIQDRTDSARLELAFRQIQAADAKASQASEQDAAKSRFLSTISHELRTPLHGMISALELMELHGIDEPELRALHKIASRASEAALQQVNRVLEITRFEARIDGDPVKDSFDPAEIVRNIIEQMHAFATKRGNKMTFSQSGLLDAGVVGDAYLFRQIVQNLIGNALKFTADGNVNVHLGLEGLENGHIRLDLNVSDTGMGFEIAQKERLLKEFETGNDRQSRIEDGAGIGLSLVNRAVRRMNGGLDISSSPGHGSAFRVMIDFTPSLGLEKPVDVAPTAMKSFDLSVLVVDDGEINRTVLGKLLSLLGCRVTEAESGAQALKDLSAKSYDLVFMDISMPDMDGIEATRRYFAARAPGSAQIVGLTANAGAETRKACLAVGMTDVLVKPLRRAVLEDFLTSFVENRH